MKMGRYLVFQFNSYVLCILCIWPVITCLDSSQTQNFTTSTWQNQAGDVNENVNSTKIVTSTRENKSVVDGSYILNRNIEVNSRKNGTSTRENNSVIDGSYILNKNTKSRILKTFLQFKLSLSYVELLATFTWQ